MKFFRCARAIAVASAAVVVTTATPTVAQSPEQFYAGKNIDLVIGYPPAGSNDIYARLLGRHIGKHIPGNPTIVPRNTPGAGSFLALAQVSNVAPKDGTVIAHRRADGAARREARHAGRAFQDRRSSTGSGASIR